MHGTQKKAPVLTASGRPPPRVIFFAPLEARLDPAPLEMVNFGYTTAKFGHAAQKRDDGSRYFDHPKAAAWICIDELRFYDPRAIIDMLLHDLCEDADLLSPYRLRLNFGLNIALDVQALTKLPDGLETTEQYLGRVVSRGPHPILAKLCDRLHNQRTLGARSADKRKDTIDETRNYHIPILIPALAKCGEPWDGFAEKLRQKLEEASASYH